MQSYVSQAKIAFRLVKDKTTSSIMIMHERDVTPLSNRAILFVVRKTQVRRNANSINIMRFRSGI